MRVGFIYWNVNAGKNGKERKKRIYGFTKRKKCLSALVEKFWTPKKKEKKKKKMAREYLDVVIIKSHGVYS